MSMDLNELHEQLGHLNGRVETNSDAIKKLEDVIEKVRDRVPPWIVLLMTGMSGLLGSFITIILSRR